MVTKRKTKTSKKKSKSSKKSSGNTRKKSARSRATVSRKASAKKKTSKKKAAKKATKKKVAKKTSRKKVAKKATKKRVAKKTSKKKAAKKTSKKKVTKKASKKKVAKKTSKAKAAAAKKVAPAPVKKAVEPEAPPKPKVPTIEEALAKLSYSEGDHVVHPKYGLGRVMAITERRLTERVLPCLLIHFSHQDMRLTIPVDQVERSGLRSPMSRRQADEVFKVLRGRATFDAKRRSAKRVADYQKRVRQGDPLSLAEVVRDLSRLGLKKTLSYEERKIQSEALRILSREVALARGRETAEVLEEIELIVNR